MVEQLVAVGLGLGGLGLAAWMIKREVRIYRDVRDVSAAFFKYTRRRLIRRVTGAVLLALLTIALFFGLGFMPRLLENDLSGVYVVVVGVLFMGLVSVPFLDFYETYKHLRLRNDEELVMKALEEVGQKPGHDVDRAGKERK